MEGSEDTDEITSERSLKNRLMEEQHPTIHAIKEVELVSYLTYKHPVTPLDPPADPIRLVSSENIHYFFQGEW